MKNNIILTTKFEENPGNYAFEYKLWTVGRGGKGLIDLTSHQSRYGGAVGKYLIP